MPIASKKKSLSGTRKLERNSPKVVLMPWKNGSRSAAALAASLTEALKYKVVQLRTEGSRFVPKARHVVVNWGCSRTPTWMAPNVRILNHPNAVAKATNKLKTFQEFQRAGFDHIPPWTTDRSVATEWLEKGVAVVCRTVLNGHSGRGIVLADRVDQLVAAPLYTQYVKKLKEFRCHVAFGNVIDVQEKRRRSETGSEADNRIRNHSTGWVYCREEITEPDGMRDVAITALAALGLDFGAVDILFNQHHNRCLVLEVNTACGLEGTTLQTYVNLVMEKINENR